MTLRTAVSRLVIAFGPGGSLAERRTSQSAMSERLADRCRYRIQEVSPCPVQGFVGLARSVVRILDTLPVSRRPSGIVRIRSGRCCFGGTYG